MNGLLPRRQVVIIIILTVAGPGHHRNYPVTRNLVHNLRGTKQESPPSIPLEETLPELLASVKKNPNNINELLAYMGKSPHKSTSVFVFGLESVRLKSEQVGGLPEGAPEAPGTRSSKPSEREGVFDNCVSVSFPESESSTNNRRLNVSFQLLHRSTGPCLSESYHTTDDVRSVLAVSTVGKQEFSARSFTLYDIVKMLSAPLVPSTCRHNLRETVVVIPDDNTSVLCVNVYVDYAPALYSHDLNNSRAHSPGKEDTTPETNPLADKHAKFTEMVQDLPEISQKQSRKHFSPFWSKLFNSLFLGDSLQMKETVALNNENNYVLNTIIREVILLLIVLLTIAFRPPHAFDVSKLKLRTNAAYLENAMKLFFSKWTWARDGQEKKQLDVGLVDVTISDKMNERYSWLKSTQLDLMNTYIRRPWLQKASSTHAHYQSCCSSSSPLCCSCQDQLNRFMPGSQRTVTVRPAFLPYPTGNPGQDLAHVGYRLATLAAVPSSCPVSRIKLADAGFYSRGNGDQVTCYSCGLRHSDWRAEDIPIDIHRRLSPNCQHVQQRGRESAVSSHCESLSENGSVSNALNSATSHATPQSQSSHPPPPPEEDSEGYRPSTTISASTASNGAPHPHGPPAHNSAVSLVSSTQSNESRAPEAGSSGTRRMTAVPPSDAASSSASFRPPMFPRARLDLGGAVYPAYNSIAHRRRTFTHWDETQAPPLNQILLSGMFYAGYADCVRCFYCGVGLKSWVVTDNVWDEHIRWRPECGFLRTTKGEQFIKETQRRLGIEPGAQIQNGYPPPPPPGPPQQPGPPSGQGSTAIITSNGATSRNSASSSTSSTSTSPIVMSSSAAGTLGPTASTSALAAGGLGDDSAVMPSARGDDPGVQVSNAAGEQQHLGQLQAANQRLARELLCRVCRRLPVDTVLFPCAHLVVCDSCSASVTSCPLCRENVTARIQITED